MPSRSRSRRATLAGRLPLAAALLVVVGPTVAPRAALPATGADPPRMATRVDSQVPPLRPPVPGRVVRGFEPPGGPYGPGHRGIDVAAPLGVAARAPAAGRVVFAGQVAGLGWVSVAVAAGVVVTVGPLDRLVVAAGQQVVALSRLGGVAAGHPGGLHLGLRVDGVYVDPLPYLVGAGPPRLAPLPLRDRQRASAAGEQLQHRVAHAEAARPGRAGSGSA